MTKESQRNIDQNLCIFKETFNSLWATQNELKGTATNVIYNADGTATFNGTSSLSQYKKVLKGVYSVRLRFREYIISGVPKLIVDFRNTDGSGTGYINESPTTLLGASSGTMYINGITSTTLSISTKEIIVSGITLNCNLFTLFANYLITGNLPCVADLVEIYTGTLSAQQVSHLFNTRTNRELSNTPTITCILDYNSLYSKSADRIGNVMTETAMSYPQCGARTSAKFNGSTSKIDLGSSLVTNQTILYMGWVRSNYPVTTEFLIGNGAFGIWVRNTVFYFSRNFGSTPLATYPSARKGKWTFIAILSEGISTYRHTMWYGDVKTPVTQLFTGTHVIPTAPTQNFVIGSGDAKWLSGNHPLSRLEVFSSYDAAIALQRATQFWSNTRRYFN